MKFVVESVSAGAARCGRLTKSETVALKTPGFLHYTKSAAIPYLSREVFNYLANDNQFGYSLSVDSTIHMLAAVRAHNTNAVAGPLGISGFASLPNGPGTTLTCLSVRNAGELCPGGHHEQDRLPVWTRNGKRTLSSAQYMEYVEAFRPDMFVTLCDGDTDAQSSRKRALRSADRTERFVAECAAKWRESEGLRAATMMLAPIEGGYLARTREDSCKSALAHSADIGGYLLDGFHSNGGSASLLAPAALNELVATCVAALPADKLRVMFGAYAPATLLRLCAAGVDLFDNSYAYLATKHSCALTFAFDADSVEHDEGAESKSLPFDLDLGDEKYKTDFTPLRSGCSCLACTKHTRAYVHHLVRTNELLASILLMLHNVHHYALFFEAIRTRVIEDNLAQLIQLIDSQLVGAGSLLESKLRAEAEKKPEVVVKAEKKRRHSTEHDEPASIAAK